MAVALFTVLLVGACAPASLRRGDRIRVESSSRGAPSLEGTLLAVGRDSVRLAASPGADSIAVALADLRSLEVARGRSRKTLWGAALGGLVAGAVGASVGRRSCGDSHPLSFVCVVEGALLFGVPGAALGAVAGAFIRGEERWERVPPGEISAARASP